MFCWKANGEDCSSGGPNLPGSQRGPHKPRSYQSSTLTSVWTKTLSSSSPSGRSRERRTCRLIQTVIPEDGWKYLAWLNHHNLDGELKKNKKNLPPEERSEKREKTQKGKKKGVKVKGWRRREAGTWLDWDAWQTKNHIARPSTYSQLAGLSFKTLQIVESRPVGVTESSHYML